MQKYRKQIVVGLLVSLAIYVGVLVLFDSQGQFTEGVGAAMQNFPWWTLGLIALAQTGTFTPIPACGTDSPIRQATCVISMR